MESAIQVINTFPELQQAALTRAWYFARLNIETIKPPKNPARSAAPRELKYNPEAGDVMHEWTAVINSYTVFTTSEKTGKRQSHRMIDCDCSCGRTLSKPISTYKFCKGESRNCRLCANDSKRRK